MNATNDHSEIYVKDTHTHNLSPLNYYYDDDWGHRGNKAWGSKGQNLRLYYCKKCRQVLC